QRRDGHVDVLPSFGCMLGYLVKTENESMVIFLGILALAILALLVDILSRPFYIHRGLTDTEWKSSWFGDEFVPGAAPGGSRALLIEAPAAAVWPWLTQIGQDRAGFYSYRWLENLVGAKMPDVRELRPEWSTRSVGQKLIMAPVERFGPIAAMDIVALEENRAIVTRNAEGVWSFLLVPISDNRCRLVARGTWLPARNWFLRLMHGLVFDPMHYVMEWKMLRSIKKLAEHR
ncbi:MAG TPA: hypothetical protein VK171_08465, partial [Fimbriimonas sp.]|nr:hypothetical protein [Fimbriimonas sp.]